MVDVSVLGVDVSETLVVGSVDVTPIGSYLHEYGVSLTDPGKHRQKLFSVSISKIHSVVF
jgi:hypothetical protein